jgi:hypothetical protein
MAVAYGKMHKDYSSTPLARKLGIKEGSRVALAGAPEGFEAALEPLPVGARVARRARPPVDVAVLFATRRAELDRRFPTLAQALEPDGGLWVAWPKKAAKVETDLSFETVQERGLEAGLVDNKSCSIDDVFQGLRFVYRLADRARP